MRVNMRASADNKKVIDVLWQSVLIVALSVAVSFSVNHFRSRGLPLVGDWSPKAQLSELKTLEEPVVTMEEARALFLTQGAVFIDARGADLFREGHIQGALNVPPDSLEDTLLNIIADVSPDSLIITYCDGETCELSKDLALQLAGKGYSHVRVLVNGWSAWLNEKLPTQSGP